MTAEPHSDRSTRGRLQAMEESLRNYPAIVAMHEEQTERAEAEVERLHAENKRLRDALAILADLGSETAQEALDGVASDDIHLGQEATDA